MYCGMFGPYYVFFTFHLKKTLNIPFCINFSKYVHTKNYELNSYFEVSLSLFLSLCRYLQKLFDLFKCFCRFQLTLNRSMEPRT